MHTKHRGMHKHGAFWELSAVWIALCRVGMECDKTGLKSWNATYAIFGFSPWFKAVGIF